MPNGLLSQSSPQSVPVTSTSSQVNNQSSQVDISDASSILDILLAEHNVSQDQYTDIKLKSIEKGIPVETIIEEQKLVSEAAMTEARARLLGIPYISLSTISFSPHALALIPQAVVERFQIIPIHFDEKSKTLSIAMANPVDFDAVTFVRQKTGVTIKTFAAAPSEIKKAIAQQYKQELVGQIGEAIKETQQTEKAPIDSKKIALIVKEAPIAKIVSTILEYAVSSRASDVHIEPQEDRLRVRYRIDGILYDKLSLPKNVQDELLSRIKILSAMKIDEHRTPQDGRFNFVSNANEVDLRVSTVPTVNGEKIVMRLLRKSGGVPTLAELGLTGTSLKHLEIAIQKPHGIIIVCGPTGSGKTTTLYAVLSRLNTTRVNIVSLEDPVEYVIPGVNQVQVNSNIGLTFATGLRSFLRQDPNIILVGEIRDSETTELAIQAALTGHLVFSTLHTSNAAGALPRLLDLGGEKFLVASTVSAFVGQRIVRKICTHCKVSFEPPGQIVAELQKTLGPLFPKGKIEFYKGKGCNECGSSGYSGRIGIFEVLPVTQKIARMILEHPDSDSIQQEAVTEGMITMKQDGYLKVLHGLTTIEEVLRVAS